MADLVMRKRGAMHAGELGLFIDSQVFEDDFAEIRQGIDLQTEVTQPHNLKQFRLAWALAAKIAKSGAVGDLDRREVMDYLLKKCRHVKYIHNKHRDGEEMEIVVRSIRWTRLEPEAFTRLFNRMIYVITSEIIPGMPEGDLRAEVEKMAGVEPPEPKEPKQRRRRAAPKSEIPATEPVTASQVNPTSPARPAPSPHGGAGTVSSADAQPPAPASAPPPPPVAAQTTEAAPIKTVAQWRDHAMTWLKVADNDPEITDIAVMAKWRDEMSMRNDVGLTADERQPVFDYYTDVLDRKRKMAKPI